MAFGSLFMVAGKRYAELQLGRTHRRQDPQVAGELHQSPTCGSSGRCRPPRWWSATACGHSSATAPTRPGSRSSMIPFTIAILRYAVDVDGGLAGEPEEIALQRPGTSVPRGRRGSEPSVRAVSPRSDVGATRPAGGCLRSLRHHRRISLWASVLVVAALFGWGAWQRRWIADDGLIVLRTVRNLLAGNGPVFNAGERVEANTSTLWTYLIYVGRLDRRPGAAGVRGAGAGAGAQRARRRVRDAGRRAGCTRRACGAAARCCCPRVCWSTSRCRRRATSPPPASKTVWCWPISACCGG